MHSHLCPTCAYPLLCHIRHGQPYWYCLYCRQEIPYAQTDQAEPQVRELASEYSQWFSCLMQTSFEGVWIADNQGYTTFVSPRMAQMLGFNPENMHGHSLLHFLEAESRLQFGERLPQLQQGQFQCCEVQLRRRDGSLLWVTLSAHPMFRQGDEFVGFLAIVTDINQRKHTQKQLQENQSLLQAIIQAAPVAIIALDNQGQIKLWNQAAEKILGWSAEEVMGRRLPELMWEDASQWKMILHKSNFAQPHSDLETRQHRKDGTLIDINLSTAPLYDAAGQVVGTMGVITDITMGKHIQEILLQQAQRERLMSTIARNIHQSLSLDQILATTTEQVCQMIEAMRVAILRLRSAQEVTVVAEAIGSEEVIPWLGLNFSTTGDDQLQAITQAVGIATHRDLNLVFLPILIDDPENLQLWGWLVVQPSYHAPLSESVLQLLQQLEVQLGMAIWQSQLYEQSQLQLGRERTLNRITQAIRRTLDLKTVFAAATWEIGQLLNLQRVQIWQLREQFWHSEAEYRASLDSPVGLGWKIADVNNPVAEQLRRLEIVINCPFQEGLPWQGACLAIPLRVGEHLWGALVCYRDSYAMGWSTAQVDFFRQISDQLAIAIQQSELYTQLQQANHQLQQLVRVDGLTQVASRRYFDEFLETTWQNAFRERLPLSLLMADIDYFKAYNDRYGHQSGDLCLQQVAQTIQKLTHRRSDLVARYGGEEFAVVLPGTDAAGALQVGLAIVDAVRKLQIEHGASPLGPHLTLSLGVATLDLEHCKEVQVLLDQADQALYMAKNQGRDRVVVYPGTPE